MKTIHSRGLGMLLLLFTFTNTAATMRLLSVKANRNTGHDESQLYRIKRNERGYMRGQTQSQYMNFGKPDVDAGKAEAEATENGSRSIVYGSQGMGQAQSQFSMANCNECIPGTLPFISSGKIGTTLHPSSIYDSTAANRTHIHTGVPGIADSLIPQTVPKQAVGGQIPGTADTLRGIGSPYGTQVPGGTQVLGGTQGGATYAPTYEPGGPYIPGGGAVVKTQPPQPSIVFGSQMKPNISSGQISGQFPDSSTHYMRKPIDTYHVDVSPSVQPVPSYGDISQSSADNRVIQYDTSPEKKGTEQGMIIGAPASTGTPVFREGTSQPYTPIFDTRPSAPGSSMVIPQAIDRPSGPYSTHPLKDVYSSGQQPGSAMQPVLYPSGYKPSYIADKSYGTIGAPGVGIGVGQIITIAPIHPHPEFVKHSLSPSIQQQPSFTYSYPTQPLSPQTSTGAKPIVSDIYKQKTPDSTSKTDEYRATYSIPGSQMVVPTGAITSGTTSTFADPRLQYAPTVQTSLPSSSKGLQATVPSQGKADILRLGQIAYTQIPAGSVYSHPTQVNLIPQAIPQQGYPKPQLTAEYPQTIPSAGLPKEVMLPTQPTSSLQKTDLPANVNVHPITGYPQTIRDVIPQQHVMQPSVVSTVIPAVPQGNLPTFTTTQLGYAQPGSSVPTGVSFQDPRLLAPFPPPQIGGASVQPQSSFAIPSTAPKYAPDSYSGLQQLQPGITHTGMQPISVPGQPGSPTITGASNGYFRSELQLPIAGTYGGTIQPGTTGSGVGIQTGSTGYIGQQPGGVSQNVDTLKQTVQTPFTGPSTGYGSPLQPNVRYQQYIPTYDGSAGTIYQPSSVAGYPQTQFDVQPYQPGISKEGQITTLPQTGTISTYTQPSHVVSSIRNDSIQQGGREILIPSVTGDQQGTILAYNDTFQVDAGKGDIFSQAETSINNGQASASAEGKKNGGSAKTLVQGTYTSTGSFSASAMTSDNDRSANSQVSGSVQGAMSQAQAQGGPAQSQSQVQINNNTGGTKASSQSNGLTHQSQSEVQANDKGGLADAQSSGPGQTSSQAQIGFRPGDNSENSPSNGVVQASSQSGLHSGQSQSQIQGKSKLGITYYGAAQSASGTKDQVAGYREKIKDVFNSINQFENSESRSNHLVNTINTSNPALISDSRLLSNLQLKASKKVYKNVHFSNTSDDENTIILGEEDGEDHYDEYDDDEDYNSDISIKMEKKSDSQSQKTINQNRFFTNDLQLRRHTQDMPLAGQQISQKYNSTANSKVQKYNRHLVKYSTRSTTETIPSGFRGTINIEKNIHTKALEMQNSGNTMNTSSVIDIKPRTHDSYVTVTKSVTGTMDNSKDSPKDNRNFQSTFYTKSSTCGYFTFSCNIVYGENGRSKICRPKAPTKGNC